MSIAHTPGTGPISNDAFGRSNRALHGDNGWLTLRSDTGAAGTSEVQIVSFAVEVPSSSNIWIAYRNAETASAAGRRVQCMVRMGGTGGATPYVILHFVDRLNYTAAFLQYSSGSYRVGIFKYIAGASTTLLAATAVTYTAGTDAYLLYVSDPTNTKKRVFFNGVQVGGDIADSAAPTGKAAMLCWRLAGLTTHHAAFRHDALTVTVTGLPAGYRARAVGTRTPGGAATYVEEPESGGAATINCGKPGGAGGTDGLWLPFITLEIRNAAGTLVESLSGSFSPGDSFLYTPASTPPATPTLSALPTSGDVALTGSAFSDADVGDVHAASRWQVTADADTGFAAPVYDSGAGGEAAGTAKTVTGLASATAYRARVQYRDTIGNWSAWSAAATFTTYSTGVGLARLDPATLALYLSGRYDVHARIRVANGSGTMVDMQGRWTGLTREVPNPDAPIGSLSVDFVRETDYGGADSLSPLVQVSAWNRLDDAVTYSPLLIAGRLVTLDVALTAERGARPAGGSALWFEVFRGHVANAPGGGHYSHAISIRCNEYPGLLKIAKSEAAYTYAAGTPIETAIRAVLDNNGFASYALEVPVPSGKVLPVAYAPGRQKTVWEQVWALAQSYAAVIWPRYRADNTPALTLFQPERDKAEPDMVAAYRDFAEFDMPDVEIFNVGWAQITNASGVREDVGPVVDAASIAKYGNIRRAFWISFGADSPVRTPAAAMDVLGAAVSDRADPDAVATATVPAMPFVECGSDLYTFGANPRFFDTPQTFAPYAASFSVRADQPHTGTLAVRGKPSAGSRTYRGMMGTGAVLIDDPRLTDLYDAATEDLPDGSRVLTAKRGPATASVWGAARTFPLPMDFRVHKTLLLSPGVLERLSEPSITLPAPASLHYTLGCLRAANAAGEWGEIVWAVNGERFSTQEELAIVEQAAADATLAAAGAVAAVDGKITTFFQAGAPVAEAVGDLWMDTDDGNKLYRWSGSAWDAVPDQRIANAIAAAADAQETADGKIVSFYQATTPTADGVGDLWTDTDDQNHLHRWNGSAWVSVRDGRIAIAEAAASDAQLAAADALAVADGKIETFFQAEPPTGTLGDLWIDTNDGNKFYRHDGTTWVLAQDSGIPQAIADAAGAQATADGKVTTFYGASAPTAEAVGDLWVDTDDNNHLYRWSGSAWISVRSLLRGVRIASITGNADGLANASVVVNVETNVAAGLGGVQYKIGAGAWNDATVTAERTATFSVAQTGVVQALTVRGVQDIGNDATAGQPELGEIPPYVAPPAGTAPPSVVDVVLTLQATGSCFTSTPAVIRIDPTFFGVASGYHWEVYSRMTPSGDPPGAFSALSGALALSTGYYDHSLVGRSISGGGVATDLEYRVYVVRTSDGAPASAESALITEAVEEC